jgi:hypothetical protein
MSLTLKSSKTFHLFYLAGIDLVTLHGLLEFLSAIIYMYICVSLNSVSKTLWWNAVMYHSESGGCCDCGDKDAWKISG